jgi:translation initiation factor IF-3
LTSAIKCGTIFVACCPYPPGSGSRPHSCRGELISTSTQRVNEQIRAREVRLIDETGKQLGIYPTREALGIARERNLDLVEVAPNADPPVCRLLNYGKYVYERAKREREARRAQRTVEIKEIRLRPKTDDYHASFKIKQARRFLAEGAKVKVRVLFRGREITHPEIGREVLSKVAVELQDVAVVEQEPGMEGRTMLMLLAPTPPKR